MKNYRILYAACLTGLLLLQLLFNNVFTLTLLAGFLFLTAVSVLSAFAVRNKISAAVLAKEPLVRGPVRKGSLLLEIRNDSLWFAPYVRAIVQLRNSLTGQMDEVTVQNTVPGKTSLPFDLPLKPLQTGKVTLSVPQLTVLDLFRILRLPVNASGTDQTFAILPPVIPTAIHPVETLQAEGNSELFSDYEPGSDPTEMYDLREYEPGDPVRSIHWKISSKLDEPYVREFSNPLSKTVGVLMDLSEEHLPAVETTAVYGFNLSRALAENGIPHQVFWASGKPAVLCQADVEDPQDLEEVLSLLLTTSPTETAETTLKLFLPAAEEQNASTMTLFYLTADPAGTAAPAVRRALPDCHVIVSPVPLTRDYPLDRVTALTFSAGEEAV